MAFPYDQTIVEAGLGGSLRQKLIDSGAVAVWPFDELAGGAFSDVVGDHDGTVGSVSRNSDAFLPEYGSSMGFNGTSSLVQLPHASTLTPTTSFAMAVLI